jgi:hypothetical protein
MRRSEEAPKWVVYETITGPDSGRKSVCTAADWSALMESKPDENRLVMEGIANENEADKLARGTSGDKPPRVQKQRPSFE